MSWQGLPVNPGVVGIDELLKASLNIRQQNGEYMFCSGCAAVPVEIVS